MLKIKQEIVRWLGWVLFSFLVFLNLAVFMVKIPETVFYIRLNMEGGESYPVGTVAWIIGLNTLYAINGLALIKALNSVK